MPMMDLGAHSSRFRVLWADEHAEVCRAVAAVLAGSFDLHVSSDARAVLELVRESPPALVCVAASLRAPDGTPLLRALRAFPNLQGTTLMLSCPRGQEASLSQDLLAAADDLVLTPISAHELSVRVQGHWRSWCARDQGAEIAFLSSLGHELRTPLTAILLWSSSLRAGGSETDLERALGCIASSAQEQSRRIDDLLDLSRLAAGKLTLNRGSTCMSSLLRSAWDELWPLAAAKHIVLAVELVEPIGTAEVDAGRLRQVLSNLLSNAIKFTHSGGTVRLRARRHQDAIEIEVSDTGEGIAPQFMPRLFQRFQRGDAANEGRHPGIGIGLALSRQLVQLHGGDIEAHSAGSGQGATFLIRLPVPRAQEAELAARAERPAARPTLRGRTILLVEDHDETREAMQFVLERAGGHVLPADTGLRGLTLLGADAAPSTASSAIAVDVIVCDLGLPDISGYEFMSRVVQAYARERRSVPPACAVSAHAREVDRLRAIEAGFDLHLAKPVTALGLMEAVDDLCHVSKTPAAEGSASTCIA